MLSKGFRNTYFYITNKEQYVAEAVVSADSVHKADPNAQTFLFCASPLKPEAIDIWDVFDTISPIALPPECNNPERWYLSQTYCTVKALEAMDIWGIDRAIYLDVDTYVCHPVPELFSLLIGFNIAGAHAPGRKTAPSALRLEPCFPELNIGVNPMRVNEAMIEFWQETYKLYLEKQDVYGNNDQAALRDSLWLHTVSTDDFKFYVLPPEYNFRFNQPAFASGKVKILHGHPHGEFSFSSVEEGINRNTGIRVWTPL